ncbi:MULTISPECIES: hypothetical protein [unclassified Mesotoga]|uniref:hypothetical protein n=1 Tax=unclassified Mesotoga TaxID=1184398 RepID=UPI000DA67E19|nr:MULTISPECIES: hypothetical protein [unclassified Mesotoga]PZC52317.1 hypothetical protein LH53_05740 [Mesotoga sp. TolDC]
MGTQVFLGENVQVTISSSGLELLSDGDIEVNVEKNEVEKRVRGKAVVQHVLSKVVNVTGSIDGLSRNGTLWDDVISWFASGGAKLTKIDDSTLITAVQEQPALSITFDEPSGGGSWKLTDVKVKTLKLSYPQEDVIVVSMDIAANGMEKVGPVPKA